ncbi:uncharacterized protein C3orf38 homolog isoform X1 [Tubulanus polymorphus]|uniref:uncharacterized protein C3orf38 homolog isoform X1 n=1 Tax=Tubulanus polymorphus TaxID=672921 RepID=UPI003DA2E8F9
MKGNECREWRKIFSYMSDDAIKSLAYSVSSGIISTHSRAESMEAIFKFTQTSQELFSRQKIKKDALVLYLVNENVSISPNAGKQIIIQKILEKWKSPVAAMTADTAVASELSRPTPTSTPTVAETSQPVHNSTTIEAEASANVPGSTDWNVFAWHFARWFYDLWNATNPQRGGKNDAVFSPDHLWPDCQLILRMNRSQVDHVEGAFPVHEKLLQLTTREMLVFSHNGDGGVRGRSEPHGLVQVKACGTVYQDRKWIGVFEHDFGLVKDPATQDNYRIRTLKFDFHTDKSSGNTCLEPSAPLPAITI